jgi:glycosyltransferase involved in cell wall biosynthesis
VRILYVSPFLPWPHDHGGRIRSWQLLAGIREFHQVRVVAGVPHDDDGSGQKAMLAAGISTKVAPLALPGPRLTLPQRARKFFHLATNRSSLPGRFWSPALAALIGTEARDFDPDGVVLDQSFMGIYAPLLHSRPYLLSTYNLEGAVQKQRADTLPPGLSRRLALLEARRLLAFEAQVLRGARRAVACSEGDREALAALAPSTPVDLVANGVDLDESPLLPPPSFSPLRMAYLGSYEYPPNLEAARSLVEEVLPRVRLRAKAAEVLLIGRGCEHLPQAWRTLPGVTILGRVANVAEALRSASVLVFPLSYGGGSRLKIIEGMALGRPVVTTQAGMDGLSAVHQVHLLIGSDSGALAEEVLNLRDDRALRSRLLSEGRRLVEAQHGWKPLRIAFRESVERAFDAGRSPP